MKIVRLELRGFVPHDDAGINHLIVDFNEKVELIVGSNGSGKSTTTNQTSLYPSARSLFHKNGFKSLVVEQDGVFYRIEAEYDKPSSPHAIYVNDDPTNINPGGTTDVQKDLIASTIGITPLMDDLIINRLTFPKWTVAKRKEFLMDINPAKIGFILPLQKQQSSKIRACKNILSRLQSRKIMVEQELLSDETIASLETEKGRIAEDLSFIQKNLLQVEIGLGKISLYPIDYDESHIRKSLKDIRNKIGSLGNISRDDGSRKRRRDHLIGKIASCDHHIQKLDNDLLTKSEELSELEVQYRELTPDGDLSNLEETITRLENERGRLHVEKPSFQISRQELDVLYLDWETIRQDLLYFETCSIPLYSRKRRELREKWLGIYTYNKSSYEMRLGELRSQYEDLSKRHKISPRDIPTNNCAKEGCPLYNHFMEGYSSTEERRQMILYDIKRLEKRLFRCDQYIELCTSYFRESEPYFTRTKNLVEKSRSNPILHSVLSKMDILTVLKTSPNTISQRLKDAYDHIDKWLKLRTVVEDLNTAYALRNKLVSSQNSDAVTLVVTMENLKTSLYELRNELNSTITDKDKAVKELNDLELYEHLKETVLRLRDLHMSYLHYLSDKHETERLLYLKTKMEELRSHLFIRSGEIERTLRDQTSVRDRYQEEIVKEMNIINKELSELIMIEKALIDIPKEYTIRFINDLFDQANRLIDVVWNIPFKIELLDPTKDIDYDFKVSGDNDSIREMSDCSEGQLEILTLAINLAIRIKLNHTNIPLCLDETGRTFDELHKQNLIVLLQRLLDDNIISQLFYISHNASTHESFPQSETLVLRDDNIVLPAVYNKHAIIT